MNDDAVFSYYVPIDPIDLRAIAESLRTRDVFSPTFLAPEVDRYDPVVYRHQAARFSTSTALLVDRNVLSRLVDLVRGRTPTAEHRLAAGVFAFAQCAEIDIEPNIALYELARVFGHSAAVAELVAFRVAGSVHPGYWAEIALGREDVLGEIPGEISMPATDLEIDFSIWLRRWRRNYVLALKIAELELRGGDATCRMSEFIGWMYQNFLLGGPALTLASHYLAPNARRKRLLKNLRSVDRERALEGVRNTAWDLTLISEWVEDVAEQEANHRLTLLTSFDRGLHRLARSVVDVDGGSSSPEQRLHDLFVSLWGEHRGRRLAAEVRECYSSLENPERQIHQRVATDFVGSCIESGEAAIRRWLP